MEPPDILELIGLLTLLMKIKNIMFGILYKHSHGFYLPSQLIEDIFNSHNELTSKLITLFFSSNLNSLQKKQIGINKITDLLFYINVKFKTERELNSFKKFPVSARVSRVL